MSPSSQVIGRNLARMEAADNVLLVRPPADELALQLGAAGLEVEALSHSYASHSFLAGQGVRSHFSVSVPDGQNGWSLVILFQPREKALLEMMAHMAAGLLDDHGELWLVGENRSGIKSAGKRLSKYFRNIRKLDSARHCSLFSASQPHTMQAYELSAYTTQWPLKVQAQICPITTLPGVFASGRLDEGTEVLLNALAQPPLAESVNGRVLDFGCGSGTIAVALAKTTNGIEPTLLDDSVLAIESSRLTLAANKVTAEVVASNGLGELLSSTHDPFDWIISNPPFHAGVRQDLDTARRFFEQCPRILKAHGKLCLVANQHLPYRHWLQELFANVQVIASDRGYNVWLAHNNSPNR